MAHIAYGVLSRDLQQFIGLVNSMRQRFHTGNLPTEEDLESIATLALQQEPDVWYELEAESSLGKLDHFIHRILPHLVPKKKRRTEEKIKAIKTGNGSVQALTLEEDLDSNILHVYSRIKGYQEWGIKSIKNTDKTKPAGFLDTSAIRLIVEDFEATRFRYERTFRRLNQEHKTSILRDLGVSRLEDVFKDAKLYGQLAQKFEERGRAVLEYSELSTRSRREYNSKFGEKNKKLISSIAHKIARLSDFNSVAMYPLYATFGRIQARVQSQLITDSQLKPLLRLDYFYSDEKPNDLLSVIRNMSPAPPYSFRVKEFYHHGNLVLVSNKQEEGRFYPSLEIGRIISEKYDREIGKLDEITEAIHKFGKRRDLMLEKDFAVDKLFDGIRLSGYDLANGDLVHTFTTEREIAAAYPHVHFNPHKNLQAYVKDRTIQQRDTSAFKRGYIDGKVYPSTDPDGLICCEIQVRSPDTDHIAEFGKANHAAFKAEKVGKLCEIDRALVSGSFGATGERATSWDFIFADYYAAVIQGVAEDIHENPHIRGSKSDVAELFDRIRIHLDHADRHVCLDPNRKRIESIINGIYDADTAKRGIKVIDFADHLWKVESGLEMLAKSSSFDISYRSNEKRQEALHEAHLRALVDAYKSLAVGTKKEALASLFVGFLVQDYQIAYQCAISPGVFFGYALEFNQFAQRNGLEHRRIGKKDIGYSPGSVEGNPISRHEIRYTLKNPEPLLEFLRNYKEFNINTINAMRNVARNYRK